MAEEDPEPKAGAQTLLNREVSWPKSSCHGETDPESFNQLWFSKQFLSWTSQAVGGALHFLYCDFE